MTERSRKKDLCVCVWGGGVYARARACGCVCVCVCGVCVCVCRRILCILLEDSLFSDPCNYACLPTFRRQEIHQVTSKNSVFNFWHRSFTFNSINHQPDATVFQFIILTFVYSSTCFGRFPAHYQELNDCSGSLWFTFISW
jgi:hypothetical protein